MLRQTGSKKPSSLQGASWKTLSCICFALINAFIKYLSSRFSFAQIAFLEHFFALLWLSPFLWGSAFGRFQNPSLHIVRALTSVAGVLLWYKSISALPMGLVVALGFLGPLMTALGATFFFKESMTRGRLLALFFGLVGGIIISSERIVLSNFHHFFSWENCSVLFPLGASALFSLATLLNKHMVRTEHPLTIVASLMVPMTVTFGLFCYELWCAPTCVEWFLFVLLGGITALAHFSITRSFSCSEILFLLPIGSVRFFATTFLGWCFFGQTLGLPVYLGFLCILVGLFILGLFEKRYATAFSKQKDS